MDANQLPSAADPIAAQVGRFAAAHGITAATLAETWDALARNGMSHPGLTFAAWTETSVLGGLLAPVLMNCPNVGSMIDDLERFHPLVGTDRVVVDRGVRHAALSLRSTNGRPSHPDTVDACFTLLCRAVRRLAGEDAIPTLVTLRRPPPPDPSVYASMSVRIAFGQSEDFCRFGQAALLAPITQADPVVRTMLRPYAERRVAHLGSSWTAAVGELLAAGSLGLADIARTLAVSSRTLQSRLEDEGTTFVALSDGLRRERALALLIQPDLPVTAIAARIGFATPSAFTRACRRWTGKSPSEYRRDVAR